MFWVRALCKRVLLLVLGAGDRGFTVFAGPRLSIFHIDPQSPTVARHLTTLTLCLLLLTQTPTPPSPRYPEKAHNANATVGVTWTRHLPASITHIVIGRISLRSSKLCCAHSYSIAITEFSVVSHKAGIPAAKSMLQHHFELDVRNNNVFDQPTQHHFLNSRGGRAHAENAQGQIAEMPSACRPVASSW